VSFGVFFGLEDKAIINRGLWFRRFGPFCYILRVGGGCGENGLVVNFISSHIVTILVTFYCVLV